MPATADSPATADADKVQVETREGIAYVSLGAGADKIPVLTMERMDSLADVVQRIQGDNDISGVVIHGSASSGFCAGADVEAIRDVIDPDKGEHLAKRGQQIFSDIAGLSQTTIAAIHGPCVGGGCELALACDFRFLLDTESAKIGLPEIKLGILPGFGGTQRLPRLIGLPKALQIILNGRVLGGAQAKRMGLVDVLVEPGSQDMKTNFDRLLSEAAAAAGAPEKLRRSGLPLADRLLTSTSLGRRLGCSRALAGVMKETKAHYTAPLRALDVAVSGMGKPLDEALAEEANALGELIVTAESKALVHVYFCSEAAAKLGRAAREDVQGFRIGIMGAGVMGSGIAAAFLARGFRVHILDPADEAREKSRGHIEQSLARRRSLSEARRNELLESVLFTSKMDDLAPSDLLLEAIVEDLEVKQEVLKKAAELLGPETIFASNTSSLSIGALAGALPGPERVIGMHFFNPAEKMPLVEVVRGPKTSDRSLARVAALSASLGKYPVVVEDVPGFLVNRILSPYIAEAGRLLEEGYRLTDIDRAAVAFGMPMGPFRMLDEVGLDVAAKVQEVMTESYGSRMQAPEYPKSLVEQSRLGRKTRHGFYRYDGKEEFNDEGVYAALHLDSPTKADDRPRIQDRLILSLVLEAVRCLDERVAGAPGPDSAAQIDLATVMGMGFAPFRGGVLHYAQSLGAEELQRRLSELAESCGERFAPLKGITMRASKNVSFYQSLPS